MIVDFTVTNFRSIRDETTFSLHAERPGNHLTGNIAYPAGDKVGVLKSVGIYGANASGKSNLLLALKALEYIVRQSGDFKDGDPIRCYEPYKLSSQSRTAPVRFEVEFITADGVRYLYKVTFDKHRILEEQLVAYTSKQPAVLFTRGPSDTWEDIKFGTTFKGGKKRFPFFKNNAYLSKAGNSADAPASVRSVYNYFRQDLIQLGLDDDISLNFLAENRDILSRVSALLTFADIGIDALSVKKRNTDSFKFPRDFPEDLKSAFRAEKKWQFLCSHKTDTEDVEQFELREESAGTRRFLRLSALIVHALAVGGVVVLDELENSIHPLMAELVIKLFNDSDVNSTGAQLIFSTHNVHIMSSALFRRDQIWFSEKDDGVSRYFSLADFEKKVVKPDSPFSRWYLEGRFDAIPKIDYQNIVEQLMPSRKSDAEAE